VPNVGAWEPLGYLAATALRPQAPRRCCASVPWAPTLCQCAARREAAHEAISFAACRGCAPAAVLDCVSWRLAEIDGHPAMILPTTAGTWQMRGHPWWIQHTSRANEGRMRNRLATPEACVLVGHGKQPSSLPLRGATPRGTMPARASSCRVGALVSW
jgi:hypothetical protein